MVGTPQIDRFLSHQIHWGQPFWLALWTWSSGFTSSTKSLLNCQLWLARFLKPSCLVWWCDDVGPKKTWWSIVHPPEMGKLRLRFLFFSWFYLVAGSQKKSRNSQIGCPGAAKSDLFDGGHDVGDHWSDDAELPDQRGLHFGQGDLWLPCHTAGLLFWILLHSDDEIFQDLSGWSCFLFPFFGSRKVWSFASWGTTVGLD